MGVFIQHVEMLKKYAFGSLNMIGNALHHGPWRLTHCWIFRGQEIPEEMYSSDEYGLFDWIKVNMHGSTLALLDHWCGCA